MSAELQFSWGPRHVDWSSDGEWLALVLDELRLYRPCDWSLHDASVGDSNALKVWDVNDGSLVFGIDRVGSIADAAFAVDASFVLIGTSLGRLMRWEVS